MSVIPVTARSAAAVKRPMAESQTLDVCAQQAGEGERVCTHLGGWVQSYRAGTGQLF